MMQLANTILTLPVHLVTGREIIFVVNWWFMNKLNNNLPHQMRRLAHNDRHIKQRVEPATHRVQGELLLHELPLPHFKIYLFVFNFLVTC